MHRFAVALAMLIVPLQVVSSQVTIEYVAHASFVIESPAGVRVLIDPYNSWIWMGYQFPQNVRANAVLITHPHYDHDAAYQVPDAPVHRDPGTYKSGDVSIRGVRGVHGGAESMLQRGLSSENTIWIVETGGVRIVHTGDNATLSARDVQTIGAVDVLITGEPAELLTADKPAHKLKPRLVIPMHYALSDISSVRSGLPPVDSVIAGYARVIRRGSNRMTLNKPQLPSNVTALILDPSPDVRPWPADFLEAQALMRQGARAARSGTFAGIDSALVAYRESVRLAPTVLGPYRILAAQLTARGDENEAVSVIERALARAPLDDVATEMELRAMLARAYAKRGDVALAREQYRAVQQRERLSIKLREEADAYLSKFCCGTK